VSKTQSPTSGWLIEAGWDGHGATDYWCGVYDPWAGLDHDATFSCAQHPYAKWTKDPSQAVRFARKEDAELVARTLHYRTKPLVHEHSWSMEVVRDVS
jgi:hypothetical protein